MRRTKSKQRKISTLLFFIKKKAIVSTLVLFLPLIIRFFSFLFHFVMLWWLKFMVDNLIQYTFNVVISIWKKTFPTLGWCSFSQKISWFYCLKKTKNERRKIENKNGSFFKKRNLCQHLFLYFRLWIFSRIIFGPFSLEIKWFSLKIYFLYI